MKFSATITALIASALTLVSAQQGAGVYFTAPTLGQVWNAGTFQSITWTTTNTTATQIDTLELRNGPASNLAFVHAISNGSIQLSVGSYNWSIPANLTTDTSYVLLAQNSAGTTYSAYFTILGLAPGVNATSPSTNSTLATTTSTM